MATVLRSPWTPAEFEAWERNQAERHELVGGLVYMMVGGTAAHAMIVGSVFARLRDAARAKGCRAFATDMKLKAGENVTYPDVFVSCAPLDPGATIADDALAIVEVLSPSTHDLDFGRKLLSYQRLPSLQLYLLVQQETRLVTVVRRSDAEWTMTSLSGGGEIQILGLDVRLTLDQIYEDLDLPR
jgi:Uma2 family endonuclease